MRVFNKLVFICNICCIIAAVLRLIDINNKVQGKSEVVFPLAPVQGAVVVLGYGAIFINLIFFITWFILLLKGKKILPSGITLFNLAMLPLQIWYFFFSKF